MGLFDDMMGMGMEEPKEREVVVADDNRSLIQYIYGMNDKATYGAGDSTLIVGLVKGVTVMLKGIRYDPEHSINCLLKPLPESFDESNIMREMEESNQKSDIVTNYIVFQPTEIPHEWECVILIRTKDANENLLRWIIDTLSYDVGITGYAFTNDLIASGDYKQFSDIFVAVTESKEGYKPAVWTVPACEKSAALIVPSDDSYDGATLLSADVNALFSAMGDIAASDPLIEDIAFFQFEKPGFGEPVLVAYNTKHLSFSGRETNAYYMLPVAAALYMKMADTSVFSHDTFPRYLMGETEEYGVIVGGQRDDAGKQGEPYKPGHIEYGSGGSDMPDSPLDQLLWASKGALGE